MFSIPVEYEDFTGETVKETLYFNLTKAELLQFQLEHEAGYDKYLTSLVEFGRRKELVEEFKKIISAAYGERSADGKRFVKSPEISSAFMSSEAYSVIFMKLISEDGFQEKFMRGIMPKELVDESTRLAFKDA